MPGFRAVLFVTLSAGILLVSSSPGIGQTSDTGALAGTIFDPSGALVPGAQVKVVNESTGEIRTTVSQANGNYVVPLLPPGSYRVETTKAGFKSTIQEGVQIVVTETDALVTHLQIGQPNQEVTVLASAEQLQTETNVLGRVTSGLEINAMPLVTRNFTQIIGLNPGISTDVENAAALGRGTDAQIGGAPATVAHGGTTSDNNFQMDGVDANDIEASGHFSGGIAIPNPDTIEEFKVQTGQYDASQGRDAGANVNVVTKSGTNQFHGDVWEYFRNEKLNANDFFLNETGQHKGILRQNQFGGTFGGPIKKDKIFFFGSYQGTRQLNGVGTECSSAFSTPPLTNDRSAAALGRLFAGQTGAFGGPPIAADGSNINPAALALLQLKLPNGQYLIPTPQTVDPAKPFAIQGFSAFSTPCSFNEDQYLANGDYLQSEKSKFSVRFFLANDNQDVTLPVTNLGGPTAPGFPAITDTKFRNIAFSHSYAFGPTLFNEVDFGFHITHVNLVQQEAFKFSDVGISTPAFDNAIPAIAINGALTLGGNGQGLLLDQGAYALKDSLSYTLGRHSLRFGGGFTRYQNDFTNFHYLAGLYFLSFPDFLLGQSGIQNGTGLSNVFLSVDLPGLFNRRWRVLDADGYIQDDFKVSPRLTLNLGFRYERLGDQGDNLGRNSAFNFGLADPNPPATGTLAGFVVPSNYKGTIPPGVTQIGNNLGINGDGQNTWNPRIGFAYRLPHTERFVLRGGYGIFHSRITGQPFLQLVTGQPFAVLREFVGPTNAAASLQNPFPPPPTLPSFTPYSPTTAFSTTTFSANFQPPMLQTYNMNLQTQIARDFVLEVGYVGQRGLHLVNERSLNQAAFATPQNPIRGQTDNTVANIPLRVPIEGWAPFPGIQQIESGGANWYNAFETSLNKRFSYGLQFLASYTFARDLATDTGSSDSPNGGLAFGDQNHPGDRYGPDEFIREQRVVISFLYELPWLKNSKSWLGQIGGGWSIAGVTTIQSGHRMTIINSGNALNVFGIPYDRVQLAPGCTYGELVTSGSIGSKLNDYFNTKCLAPPPVIGADGIGTGFGNSGVGIVLGPPQDNWDIAAVKHFPLGWPNEKTNLEFRAEFFNVFNHPQFSDPANDYSGANVGQITSLAVNPRIIQFALKLNF
ncbi:MAG: TonB-dependent receptor [Acidobacteriaceae bacterium]|nr:TonB-dependent receptor [Acidobacteriaceae bacterium]MBV9782058.1 TonB-dependent receptor [Acidobacteriaceae bacterium]